MNQGPFLERRSPLRVTNALLILIVFFFFLPSGFRAARLSLQQKENDVKDWLPSDFPETAELKWFADHFAGESFVVATWPGCTSGDQRLKLLARKLVHESADFDPSDDLPLELAETYARAKQVGNQLQLLRAADDHLNWGGRNEKWLRTPEGQWYYVTPQGRLYRWDEPVNGPMALLRSINRSLGRYQLSGTLVTAFGESSDDRMVNPFYNDTSMLCASLFRTVQTGDSIVDDLASEGGSLWPRELIDEDRRAIVARRRAMQRLTGVLFAPAVPPGFQWTGDAFRRVIPDDRVDQLPVDFEAQVEASLAQILSDRFDDSPQKLRSATTAEQTDAWYEVFDSVEVEPPPRLTCVLVTLTDVAKNNLSYVVGRGVLGEPRGRLLQLAEESGIYPPAPPSMAPPPFNREPAEAIAGMPPLRMGGPPIDNMAIDEEGSVTLVRLVGYSAVIGFVLSFVCFASFKITIMVFIVGCSAAMLSMAIVWWTAGRVDAVLMSMPSLVYVLGLSGAIHVVNYYRDEVRVRGESGAAGRALRHALMPCTLASITTAIGLISLFTSNLHPISNFGFYSAIGVIMTLGILFSYLPAALQTFAPAVAGAPDPRETSGERQESRLSQWWAGVGGWITRHHVLVSTACLAVLTVGGLGLLNIKTSVQLLKLFDADARIIKDYSWLETNFGKLVPMELIVRVPPSMQAEYVGADDAAATDDDPTAAQRVADAQGSPAVQSLNMLERVEVVSRIRRVVYQILGEPGRGIVGQAMAADTFLPELPEPDNSYNARRAALRREFVAAADELRDNDYLRLEKSGAYAGSELWRISLRVAALSEVDYGRFIATLRESVEPVMRAYDTREELLNQLSAKTGRLIGKETVLVVGSASPEPLGEAPLVTEDGEIDGRATYIATLAELLRGERIATPAWLHVDQDKAQQLASHPDWETQIRQKYDAVIWLGDAPGFTRDDFAAAEHLIDGEAIRSKTVVPTLLPNQIPDTQGAGSIQVIYTGVVPVVYKAQRTLLTSLTNSIGLAFVLIAAVMIWLLNPGRFPWGRLAPGNLGNGVAAGMVAMIPNVFPVLLVFGVMCHAGIEIDIGTMMTASVAMGVAVDDTIHFLAWFRDHLDRGMNRADAIIETYRRVGPAMTQTTIVGGMGLFVFALSTFTPTQRFGTLMLVLLSAALVGDLILLPALLAGPAGRFFKPRAKSRRRPPPSSPPAAALPREAGDASSRSSLEKTEQDAKQEVLSHLKSHLAVKRSDPPHRVHRS